MLKPIIQNVVSTLTLDSGRLDLHAIARRLPNTCYRPERFSALSIRIRQPLRAVALLFGTGRLVCVGTKSVPDSRVAIAHFERMIMGGQGADNQSFQVQNIVASATMGHPLRLHVVYDRLRGERPPWLRSMSYNPEMFPGMCVRMQQENAVCLLFASGKCVITGAHQEDEIDEIFETVYHAIVNMCDQ